MTRRRRARIATGIRRHGAGLQAYIRVNGELRTQTFALDHPRESIADWLRRQALQRRHVRTGTLAADVPRYLATLADPRRRVTDAGRLAHWLRTPLADMPRALITKADLKAQLARFVTEPQPRARKRKTGPLPDPQPLSIETANKCLTVLRALYRELNTHDDDPNPAALVAKLRPDTHAPRALAYATVEAILALMPDRGEAKRGKGNRSTINKAKLRCALLAYTGWPHTQIARIDPLADIQWGPPLLVRLRPRRKGKGVAERWMPVTPKGEGALRAFVDGGAAGSFSRSSVRRAWQRACEVYRRQQHAENVGRILQGQPPLPLLPANVTPYDLRHTFIAQTLRASGNLAGTQYLAMHSDPKQTLHYAQASIPGEAAKAIAAGASAQGVATPKASD